MVARLVTFVSRKVPPDFHKFYVKPVIQIEQLVYGSTYYGKLEKFSIRQRKFF